MSEQVVPVESPVVPSAPVDPAPEALTIKEHEAQFGPNAKAGPDDDDDGGNETQAQRDKRGRYRRVKDQASADDVPRIKELSKKVKEWETKYADLEKRIPAPEKQPAVRYAPPAPPVEFTDPEPTIEQFADKDDPYGAWQRALAKWDRQKEAAEYQAQHMQAHQQRTQAEVAQYWQKVEHDHKQRVIAAFQSKPEQLQTIVAFGNSIQSGERFISPLLDWAIQLDNQSPDVAYFFATHPDVFDEFVLLTAVQPVTEQTVGTTQRLLRQRMSTVSSGAAPSSSPFVPAPRPPTPLRTAPMRTDDAPKTDGSLSLMAHAKAFKAR